MIMEDSENHSQTNALDNVSSIFEDFASLSSMLQSVYKGTNVIDVVMQLLSAYKIQGGISAYENVLLTLSSLLTEFSNNDRRRFICMVPPPKDVPIELVKSVLAKAMESFRCTTPLLNYSIPENVYDTTSMAEHITTGINKEISNKIDPNNLVSQYKYYAPIQCRKVPQLNPSVSKGVQDPSSNQSSLLCTNMKCMNNFYKDYNQLRVQPYLDVRQENMLNNRQHADSTVHRQNFFKPVCNRYLSLPMTEVTGCNPIEISYLGDSYQNVYTNSTNHIGSMYGRTYDDRQWKIQRDKSQDVCCNKCLYINNDVIFDTIKQVHAANGKSCTSCTQQNSSNFLFLPTEGVKEQHMVLQSNDAYIDKEQIYIGEVQRGGKSLMKECHTIQEDNYKMDFVCWNEQDAGIKYDEKALREDHCEVNDLIPSNELKICIQNFLKRVKQEVFIDLPGFPQTRPLHISPNPLHVVPSEFCKFKTVQQVLRNNDKSSYLVDGIEKPMLLQAPSLTSNSIGSRNMNNTVYRTKSVTTSKPKSQKINQDYIMSTFLQSCDSGRILNKAQTVASFDGKHNAEDLPNRWKEAQREEEFTPNFPQQSTSNTSKLVTCKKKFYDVLLGIQKARVASSNPLTKTAPVSSVRCDSYYSGYSYRQLSQQRGQITMSQQQFPGLTKTHGPPYTWLDSNNPNHSSPGEAKARQQPFSHSSGHE